jgi:hypothetical protein
MIARMVVRRIQLTFYLPINPGKILVHFIRLTRSSSSETFVSSTANDIRHWKWAGDCASCNLIERMSFTSLFHGIFPIFSHQATNVSHIT